MELSATGGAVNSISDWLAEAEAAWSVESAGSLGLTEWNMQMRSPKLSIELSALPAG